MTNVLDSNILVYTVEPSTSARKARARELLGRSMRGGADVFLLQTLAEFAAVAARKLAIHAAAGGATSPRAGTLLTP